MIFTGEVDQASLVAKVREMLGEFADPAKIPDEPSGVELYRFNADPKNKLMFRFVTFDDFEIRAEIDVRDVTKEYLTDILSGVVTQIHDARKHRQQKEVICLG